MVRKVELLTKPTLDNAEKAVALETTQSKLVFLEYSKHVTLRFVVFLHSKPSSHKSAVSLECLVLVMIILNMVCPKRLAFSLYVSCIAFTFSSMVIGVLNWLRFQEKDKLVAEVVRFVLFKSHQSSGCPIKREELTQIVTKNYSPRALPALIINEAKEKLAHIFGYELKELQRARSSNTRSTQQNASDAKSYIITSQLPSDVYQKFVEDVKTAHLTGFIFVIVSVVHLAGGKVSEENLWHHLRRIGLHENDDNHSVLGNVKLSLEALVQQRFLQKDKVNGPEGNIVMYELAERALDGPVSQQIKEHIMQAHSSHVIARNSIERNTNWKFTSMFLTWIVKNHEEDKHIVAQSCNQGLVWEGIYYFNNHNVLTSSEL
ncbi:hypothetical protein V2J09_003318 [Rumex salicifolius]